MLDRDADERGDVVAEEPRVDASRVPADDLRFLELSDSVSHRGLREPYLFRNFLLRQARVLLQEVDDAAVRRVHA